MAKKKHILFLPVAMLISFATMNPVLASPAWTELQNGSTSTRGFSESSQKAAPVNARTAITVSLVAGSRQKPIRVRLTTRQNRGVQVRVCVSAKALRPWCRTQVSVTTTPTVWLLPSEYRARGIVRVDGSHAGARRSQTRALSSVLTSRLRLTFPSSQTMTPKSPPGTPAAVNLGEQGAPPRVSFDVPQVLPVEPFRVRRVDTGAIVCQEPARPAVTSIASCTATLDSAGWYTFQAQVKRGRQWSNWSSSSERIYVGDPCTTVRWVPVDQDQPWTVPYFESDSKVVGYTTLAADGARTALDVSGSAEGSDSFERMVSGRGWGSRPYTAHWESNRSRVGSAPTATPETVSLFVNSGYPQLAPSSGSDVDTYQSYTRFAYVDVGPNYGVQCVVDAAVNQQIVRTLP